MATARHGLHDNPHLPLHLNERPQGLTATSLTATWQPNDERRYCHSSFHYTVSTSTFLLTQLANDDPTPPRPPHGTTRQQVCDAPATMTTNTVPPASEPPRSTEDDAKNRRRVTMDNKDV
ncbi:hypothetical protein K443DRAFT_7905 [Laccaria amethystina LaAM-08-1]|uniref:Uncharacterized protein n=1 Tax=Laccaria amethystina LaAM-08-1 TaxID=1095629 RepID=A0A0C9XQW1_9AGAR|nr:hypothetical protein K443DRAFT_7905 [Laccaria amethystina LaAM-08-1]